MEVVWISDTSKTGTYRLKFGLTNEQILLRILELLKEKGSIENDKAEYLQIENGVFTHWKYYNQKTFYRHIRRVSKYLIKDDSGLSAVRKNEEMNTDIFSANVNQ